MSRPACVAWPLRRCVKPIPRAPFSAGSATNSFGPERARHANVRTCVCAFARPCIRTYMRVCARACLSERVRVCVRRPARRQGALSLASAHSGSLLATRTHGRSPREAASASASSRAAYGCEASCAGQREGVGVCRTATQRQQPMGARGGAGLHHRHLGHRLTSVSPREGAHVHADPVAVA